MFISSYSSASFLPPLPPVLFLSQHFLSFYIISQCSQINQQINSHKIIFNIFHKIRYSSQKFSGTWNRKNSVFVSWYINPQTFIMYSNVYKHFQIEKKWIYRTLFSFFSYCMNEYFLDCLLGLQRRYLLFCGKVFIPFSMVLSMLEFKDAFSWRKFRRNTSPHRGLHFEWLTLPQFMCASVEHCSGAGGQAEIHER